MDLGYIIEKKELDYGKLHTDQEFKNKVLNNIYKISNQSNNTYSNDELEKSLDDKLFIDSKFNNYKWTEEFLKSHEDVESTGYRLDHINAINRDLYKPYFKVYGSVAALAVLNSFDISNPVLNWGIGIYGLYNGAKAALTRKSSMKSFEEEKDLESKYQTKSLNHFNLLTNNIFNKDIKSIN